MVNFATLSFPFTLIFPLLISSQSISASSSSAAVVPAATGRQSGYGYSSDYNSYSPYGADLYTAASGGGYGHDSYYKKCDCTKYDILGVVAGGAALAALGIYVLLQQAAARSLSGWTPQLSPLLVNALKLTLPQQDVAGKAVSTTCRVSRMLENGDLKWSRTYGIGARSGYEEEGGFCDCFLGLVGALAGFTALAVLAAFALQQAAAAAAARSLPDDGPFDWAFNLEGLHFVSRYLRVMTDNEDTCVPHRLCRINEDADRLSPQLYTGVKLAGLPISWFLSFSSSARYSFNELCDAIGDVQSRGGCDVIYPGCSRRGRRPSSAAEV